MGYYPVDYTHTLQHKQDTILYTTSYNTAELSQSSSIMHTSLSQTIMVHCIHCVLYISAR